MSEGLKRGHPSDAILDFVEQQTDREGRTVVSELIQIAAGMKYELIDGLATALRNSYSRGVTDGYEKAIREMGGES